MLPRPNILRYQTKKQVVSKRALGSNQQPGFGKKSLFQAFGIWHEHVSTIATASGKKLEYLFSARKCFTPSNLLTLYKAQIRPSLAYCSHIWGAAAPTILSLLDAVQRRAIRLIGDPALTCQHQPLSSPACDW
nr:unnamed protein product [Callosobruchus chinensis]